jgi:cell division ATPase FtsA
MSRDPRANLVASLDLSASCVRTVIAGLGPDQSIQVLGASRIKCNGICYGEVVDMREAARAIRVSREEAELLGGVPCPPVRVGICGDFIAKDTVRQNSKHGYRPRNGQ